MGLGYGAEMTTANTCPYLGLNLPRYLSRESLILADLRSKLLSHSKLATTFGFQNVAVLEGSFEKANEENPAIVLNHPEQELHRDCKADRAHGEGIEHLEQWTQSLRQISHEGNAEL